MALVLKPKQDDTMTVAGNGPVRFYIVHTVSGQGRITPSDYVLKSPFAIVQEDWRVALPKMAQRYPGRGEGLEIDCHGLPGILLLDPQVNMTSLHNFADALGGLLQPYGLVEFLACQVANYDVPALAQYLGSMGRKADAQFLTAWLQDSGKLPDWKGDVNSAEGRPDPGVSAAVKRIREEGLQAGKNHILKCPYAAGTVPTLMMIREQVPLAPLTTLGVGGPARYFAEVSTESDVREAIQHARSLNTPLFVLGGG